MRDKHRSNNEQHNAIYSFFVSAVKVNKLRKHHTFFAWNCPKHRYLQGLSL